MVFMNIITAAVQDVTRITKSYPIFSGSGAVASVILLSKFYFKLTSGKCDCTTDMTGKTVIITGANAGIGKYTAMELARKGARVIIGCRNQEKGQAALEEIIRETGNNNVFLKKLDLCSFASVRAFVNDIVRTEEKLHVLINNAGTLGSDKREITDDNCEKTMQSNYLGHFLMTSLLLDLLKKSAPSRIINVTSEAHKYVKMNVHDLNSIDQPYRSLTAYGCSKLANILFTRELSRRLLGTGVTANSVHPGIVKTEFFRPGTNALVSTLFKYDMVFYKKTPLEGAQTSIHLAISPDLQNVSGKYFIDCKKKEESRNAKNDASAAELWKISEKLVGLEPHP